MKNHGNKLGAISAMALVAALPERKLTKEFLESEIDKVEYNLFGSRITYCIITTKSGFVFTGESACIDPTNYDEDIGSKIAYGNAFDKMWMPYSFWLHKALADHDNRLQPPSDNDKIEAQQADDEPYQIKDTDQFTLELAIALAQNGDVVRNVNTGTTLSFDDCRHDAFWQLAEQPKSDDLPTVSAANPTVDSQEHLQPPTMDFGYAVKMMKEGKRASRIGWNGKGMWLRLAESPTKTEYRIDGEVFGFLPYIQMKTADDKIVPWLASQTDVLAEDWVITD